MTERVVLAYSGGLDTSVAIPFIAEQTGAEVVAVAVDLGQGGEDLEAIRKRALACGAVEAVVTDAREEFAGGVLLARAEGQRPLHGPLPAGVGAVPAADRQAPGRRRPRSSAAPRSPTAAPARATTRSGSRPASAALNPELKVIAPARDFAWTRDKAIAFAEEKGLPIDVSAKSPYSIDQNLWGRAVETGFLEDIWNAPIEDVYAYTADPASAARGRRGRHHLRRRRPDGARRPRAEPVRSSSPS